MIIDIPDSDDFNNVGLSLIFLAWTKTLDLMIAFEEPLEAKTVKKSKKDRIRFLECANIELQVNFTLVLQAVEFFIKARIAKESVFLLLDNLSTGKGSSLTTKIPFSELKTISANDLIKINNALGKNVISEDLEKEINVLRQKRNKIVHSVDRQLRMNFKELISTILRFHQTFFAGEVFFKSYRPYLFNAPTLNTFFNPYSKIDHNYSSLPILLVQAIALEKTLSSSEFKKYFGCQKGQKRHYCSPCWGYLSSEEHFNQRRKTKITYLKTAYREKRNVYRCYVCDAKNEV